MKNLSNNGQEILVVGVLSKPTARTLKNNSSKKSLVSKFKKSSLITVSALFFSTNLVVASGIPVVDAAANVHHQMNWIQTMKDFDEKVKVWGEEAKHRIDEVKKWADDARAYADELYTKTGVRDVVNFGKEMKDLYDEAEKMGVDIYAIGKNFELSKLDEYAWDMFIEFGGQDTCSTIKDISGQKLCKASVVSPFKQVRFLEKRIDNINDEMDEINKVLAEAQKNHGKNEDIKNSQDLANQIALLQLKMDTNERAFRAQQEQLQKQSELLKKKSLTQQLQNTSVLLLSKD